MSISNEVMQKKLESYGFNVHASTKKVVSYEKNDNVVYVGLESQNAPLILAPSWSRSSDELLAIPGVGGNGSGGFFHHSNLNRFPSIINNGGNKMHYGLAFRFDSTYALDRFLGKIEDLSARSKLETMNKSEKGSRDKKKEISLPKSEKVFRRGRPPLFGEKMTQREISERYNKSITDAGGRILTLRLLNREACEALAFMTKDRGFRSESSAATWLLEDTLLKLDHS